jgi:hypothetical protein
MVSELQRNLDIPGFEFETIATSDVDAKARKLMHELFDACYREANHDHLDRSLSVLRFVTFAREGGRDAAFGIADSRVVDLPRLPATTLLLGGLCCVHPDFRRRGLFAALMGRSMALGDRGVAGVLNCGRVAHPGAFNMMARNPTVVPKPGVTPSLWQQDVGKAVADVYGVERFDPETFVCRGSGKPIGDPVMEVEARDEDWEVFRPVDRANGDALLGIAWASGAPEGW